ncbi:MerR family transcriptional regulator [Nocardia sp. NPDC060259]|uniref:DNA polymerase III subunit beta family protein n=1 Tax=Nocardia sp. NPDC060259 TaxID=3347088 RepID=UPI003658ADF2
MSESELLTIGAFARACGLSTSALRFYADAGVLVPAVVDEITGYRYYAPDQAGTARLIRHLRAVDMPLPVVITVLTERDQARVATLVEDYLTSLDRQLDSVRAAADAARAAVRFGSLVASGTASAIAPGSAAGPVSATGAGASTAVDPLADSVMWVRGPLLAAAVDQIATATIMDPEMPVLNSIHLEARTQELILTATDRYRLATRSLRPARATTAEWTATVDADDLRAAASWLRRRHTVAIRPGSTHLEIISGDSAEQADTTPTENGRAEALGPDRRRCRRRADEFPDYRAMLAALPAVVTRVVLNRTELLDALEQAGSATITLHVIPEHGLDELTRADLAATPAYAFILGHGYDARDVEAVRAASDAGAIADPARAVRIAGDGDAVLLPATVTGPGMTIHFAVTTLYPAVAGAVGPDVMLDLIAPDLPARIRSADDGDLLTLAMPCRPDTEETSR